MNAGGFRRGGGGGGGTPIFEGSCTTTGQNAFLLVREGVTKFMSANFTPYITKIQELPGALLLGPPPTRDSLGA